MEIVYNKDVEPKDAAEGTSGVKVRWLITKEMGAPNFAMRLFEMEPGGYSPRHKHNWEHEVFVLEGEGVVLGSEGWKKFRPGDAVFIPPNKEHQFRNNSEELIKFLCLVPNHE
jgi:quercetin dioxygenase-like cupin family protein